MADRRKKYFTSGPFTRGPTYEELEQLGLQRKAEREAKEAEDAAAAAKVVRREAKVTRARNPNDAELLNLFKIQVAELQKLASSDRDFGDFISSGRNLINLAERLAEINPNNFIGLSAEYEALTTDQKKDYLTRYSALSVEDFLKEWYKSRAKPLPRAPAAPRQFTMGELKVLNEIAEEERKVKLYTRKLKELYSADVAGGEVDENEIEILESNLTDAIKQHDELVGNLASLFSASGMDRRSAINLAGKMTEGTYKDGKKQGLGKPRKCRKCGLPR
jgi:hypothetical protein